MRTTGLTSTLAALAFAAVVSTMLGAAVPARAQSIGVAVCDDFLAKYDICITSKVPEAQKAMFRSQLELRRKVWSELAKNAASKSSLESNCKQTMDKIRENFQRYGCTF